MVTYVHKKWTSFIMSFIGFVVMYVISETAGKAVARQKGKQQLDRNIL